MSEPFRIRVLGPPAITRMDGTPARISAGKPLAVLTYLALSEEPVPRDTVGELFWPGAPRNRQRASLRQALWLLRRGLHEDLFQDTDPLELAPDRVEVDLAVVLRLASEGRSLEALDLWTAPPFRDFLLPDVPEWERWSEERRFRAEEQMSGALGAEGEASLARDDFAGAIRAFGGAARIASHRPAHSLQLLRALLRAREFGQAEEILADARARFADDPSTLGELRACEGELQALRRRTYRDDRDEDTPEPEFVGRVREFAALVRAWERTAPGSGHRAVLLGEAGIGKTRLAEETAVLARSRGGRVVTVKGREGEARIRWGTAAELVRRISGLSGAAGVGQASADVLHTLAPSLRTSGTQGSVGARAPTAEFSPPAAPPDAAVVDALADLVSAVSEDGPLLLVVDDLQWVDPASRNALAGLARRTEGEAVLWVVTARTGIRDPGLERTLRALEEGSSAVRLRLDPWTPDEVRELLALLAEFPDPDGLDVAVEVVHTAGGGSPLFTVELLKRLADDGVLARVGRRGSEEEEGPPQWCFHADRLPDRLGLPVSVRDLLADQVTRVGSSARRILEALLSAPGIRPEALRELCGLSHAATTEGLGELLERRLVRWIDEDRLDFAHDEIRTVALERLGPVRADQGAGPEESGGPIRWPAAVITAVAALVIVGSGIWSLWASLEQGQAAAPLLGGGSIVVVLPDSVVEIVPERALPSDWEPRTPDWFHLAGTSMHPPRMGADGRPTWIERRQTVEDPPWIVQRLPDGEERVLVRSDGDEFFNDTSPDGEWFLYASENPDSPVYRLDLWVGDFEGQVRRRILEAEDRAGLAAWSPDGSRIAVRLAGASDTIALLTPDGDRLASRPMGPVRVLQWCGSDRLLVGVLDANLLRLGLVPLDGMEFEPLPTEGYPLAAAVCSPDGTTVLYSSLSQGEVSYLLHHMESGRTEGLSFTHDSPSALLTWLPPGPSPTPRALVVNPAPEVMQWGENVRLEPHVVLSDGSQLEADEVEWSASDPNVVSVAPDGRVHANDLGTGTVVVTWRDWLADSLRIEVRGTRGEGTLFSDEFRDPDLRDWRFVGHPRPETAELDGQPVLRLTGDGRHHDGLVTEASFPGMQGLTVELDLHLPLNRPDRQWLRLCLVDGELPDTGVEELDIYALRLASRQMPCLEYPHGYLSTFDPSQVTVNLWGLGSAHFPVDREVGPDGLTPEPDDWVHLALQLRADGTVQVYTDRRYLGTVPVALRNDADTRWRVAVFGATVDTRGFVRNLSLWQGTRYGGE